VFSWPTGDFFEFFTSLCSAIFALLRELWAMALTGKLL
jgi:hypothetical protein